MTFSAAIDSFITSLHKNTKWNFLIPYQVKIAMNNVNQGSFSKWISHKDPSCMSFPGLPKVVAENLGKACAEADKILLTSDIKSSDVSKLLKEFREFSAKISAVDFRKKEVIARSLMQLIEQTIGIQLNLSSIDDRKRLFQLFGKMFRLHKIQQLSDQHTTHNVQQMFHLLEQDPKIAAVQFARKITIIWCLPEENLQSLLTDLSEFLVRHNPYNLTVAKKLLLVCKGHAIKEKIIGKALVYRSKDPFSMKISDISSEMTASGTYNVSFISPENEKAVLTLHESSKKVICLSYSKVIEKELEVFIESKYCLNGGKCELEFHRLPDGVCNPFVMGQKYTIKEIPNKANGQTDRLVDKAWAAAKKVTKKLVGYDCREYVFTPDKGKATTFRITSTDNFNINPEDENLRQNLLWSEYLKFIYAITIEEVTLKASLNGSEKFDARFLDLSEKVLSTPGELQKRLREKDDCTAQLLESIINEDDIFSDMCSHPDQHISEDLFGRFFQKDQNFQRLCNNQYVKDAYGKKEEEFLPPVLQKKLALDCLHQALVFKLTMLHPKDHKGNRDLIEKLCEAMDLVKHMLGTYSIPFVGATGSGKSTTVSYMMGVQMVSKKNEFGDMVINHKDTSDGKIPKIGFSLGISETIHAQVYSLLPPPPFKIDPMFPFEDPPRHFPNFANGLTKDNLYLADFPGFFDTRGTKYEVITNFSIDRAMESFTRIPALIQVIPYETFTADRARMLYGLLVDLATKFPNLLTDDILKDAIHFAVTKFGEHSLDQLKLRTEKLIDEYTKQGLDGAKYFTFLLRQINIGNVHLLNPLSSTSRLEILDSIIEKYNPNINDPFKKSYKGAFSTPHMQLSIGDLIHGAILTWKSLINGFFKSQTDVDSNSKLIDKTNKEIREIKKNVQSAKSNYSVIQAKKGKELKENDPIFIKASEGIRGQKQKYEQDIRKIKLDIKNLKDINVTKKKFIEDLQREISNLTTGSITKKLQHCVRERGDKITYRKWKDGVDVEGKTRRYLDNPDQGDLSGAEDDVECEEVDIVGTDHVSISCCILLDRGYELVPQDKPHEEQMRLLNELAGGVGYREKFLDDDSGWKLSIESDGDISFTGIRVHDSGKRFMYSYDESIPPDGPWTKLIVNAVLPNAVYNKVKVLDVKSTIISYENDILRNNSEKSVKEGRLKDMEDELKNLQINLKNQATSNLMNAIDQSKRTLHALEASLVAKSSELKSLESDRDDYKQTLRCFAVSINYHNKTIVGTATCAKHFKPMESGDGENFVVKKNKEVLEACQVFASLYIQRKDKMNSDIDRILKSL